MDSPPPKSTQVVLVTFVPRMMARRLGLAAAPLAVAVLATMAAAENPYTSSVIELTPRNFRQLERGPHLWFVNICRNS